MGPTTCHVGLSDSCWNRNAGPTPSSLLAPSPCSIGVDKIRPLPSSQPSVSIALPEIRPMRSRRFIPSPWAPPTLTLLEHSLSPSPLRGVSDLTRVLVDHACRTGTRDRTIPGSSAAVSLLPSSGLGRGGFTEMPFCRIYPNILSDSR